MFNNMTTKQELAIEEMVMRVVSRDLRKTVEMPALRSEVGEFDLAFSGWRSEQDLKTTGVMPAFESEELRSMSEAA
jgi:hypothetical protein